MSKWLIERGGVQITVHAKSSAAEELVAVALAGLRPEKVNKVRGIHLSVNGDAQEWRLRDHSNNVRRKISESGDLVYHLTDRIVFHIADKVTGMHCLHAAAVSSDGVALVIPANSGAGKSSFTTWLVANGFDYITDELILINEANSIDGLGRPIQIKPHGIDAIQNLLLEPDAVYPGKLANAVPISSLGGQVSESAEHRLGLMVFPQYKKGAEFCFEKLSSAEAGMCLMANHVNARNLAGHGFTAMMSLIRSTPCFSLEYGGFNSLPRNFSSRLRELLRTD